MVVQHNLTAMNANRYLGINNSKLSKSLEKLSSGYAINRAGDNAAGLAVSEKMRSQIAGMTQGVKNAQDGISMIQTFEGALTETDSILQRMKTLADQAANGTYQDDVDRDAIQLEFDQLNDELNQIADTDFNGVIVLNGGQMADGLKQVNGKFDYANYSRDAGQLDKTYVNKLDYSTLDDVDANHGATVADTMWNDLNSAWDRGADPAVPGPDYIDFTFAYSKADGTWAMASNSAGVASTAITVTDNGNGGFDFGTANAANAINVVLDESELMNGDTITVRVNNPAAKTAKPGNIGVDATRSSGNIVNGNDTNAKKDQDLNLTTAFTLTGAMTEDMASLVKALDGATFKADYSGTKKNAAGDFSMTLTDGTTIDSNTGSTITLKDGTSVTVTKPTAAGVTKLKVDDGTNSLEFTFTPTAQANDPAAGKTLSSGSVTYTIGIEHGEYDASQLPTAEIVDPDGSKVSKSNSYTQATAPLTYTDHIILQAGARTKDSVDFTFKYTSGGLGDLKANMNCSARADGLGTANLKLTDQKSANYAIDRIDNAINKVSMVRATFGAVQNRLEHKIDNMNVSIENLTSAESGIRDTNMPTEMMNFTKQQILSQASQSMLAQANQLPQSVLSLLQ